MLFHVGARNRPSDVPRQEGASRGHPSRCDPSFGLCRGICFCLHSPPLRGGQGGRDLRIVHFIRDGLTIDAVIKDQGGNKKKASGRRRGAGLAWYCKGQVERGAAGSEPAASEPIGCWAGRFFFGAPSMGALLRVQVPLRAGHSEQSEAQLREGDRSWEGSVERKSRADEQEPHRRRCQAGRAGQRLQSSCDQGEVA